MSGRFVRASKYRHVFGEPYRKDKCINGLKVPVDLPDGAALKANKTFLAFPGTGGGGPVVVIPIKKAERAANPPAVNVHKSKALDWDFSPFLDNLIATGSEDASVRVTVFPEGGLEADVTEAAAVLEGHVKKVTSVKFHPVANNVLVSAAADFQIKIWDIQKAANAFSVQLPDTVSCVEWNTNGSLLLATCKDKTIRFFDPRVPDAVSTAPSFPGTKGSRAVWMDNVGKIACFGASATATRQYSILDPRAFEKPLIVEDIDQSAGVLLPFYDPDNQIVYIAGKGDASVKYFEAVSEAPYLHYLTEFRHTESQKGFCFAPKVVCDTKTCEIALGFRLMKDYIMPVSFQVPRKSDVFQEDIFPDTYAGVPALSEDQWLAGENREPPLLSMKDKSIKAAGASSSSSAAPRAAPQVKSSAQLQKELNDANERIKELEALVAKLQGH